LIFFHVPIHDEHNPDKAKLYVLASFGAEIICRVQKVFSHCLMGYNRSALKAGLMLYHLGKSGLEALSLVLERRPRALFKPVFADYLPSRDDARLTHPDQTIHRVRVDRSGRCR
jgi:protein-tyrosine phosphatase